ncbi:MAG: CBS domain-containing protein [Terriglobales bacterium]
MRVDDVMTSTPLCCTISCTAQVAAALMRQGDTGIIPVVEKFGRRVVGVVTDRDLCLNVVARGHIPSRVLVAECMTPNPIFCHPEDELSTVLGLMKHYQVRRIVVVDANDELKGVVSIGDLVRSGEVDAIDIYDALTEICTPSVTPAQLRAAAACAGT